MSLLLSVDFELNYGFRGNNDKLLEASEELVLSLIQMLRKHEVKSSWAIVGSLYEDIFIHKNNSLDLVKDAIDSNQDFVELGSHTYGHIFLEESGLVNFESDLVEFHNCTKNDKKVKPFLIFPRNQFDETSLPILRNFGFKQVRISKKNPFLSTRRHLRIYSVLRRILEFIPLDRSSNTIKLEQISLVEDSRFFRVYSNDLLNRWLLFVLRIEFWISYKRNRDYHIWFHVHNLYGNDKYLSQLERVLKVAKKYHGSVFISGK